MESQSKFVELQQVADVIDSLHQTPQYSDFGYPMVRVTDIKGGFLNTSSCLQVSPEIYKEYIKNHVPKKGDIVISRVGSYGITSYVNQESSFCLGQNTAIIVPKTNNRYIFYCFQSEYVKNQIESCVVGTTQKTLSLKLIKELKIPLFDQDIQDRVANILGSLDDKIELNRQMNETLEAIGRAIFQSWFVDFDPVRAKAEGCDTGLPADVAALFPDGFVIIDGRELPIGWRIGTLGDIAENIRRPINPTQIDPETPYIGLEHMPQHSIALCEWGEAASVDSGKFQFKINEFLFGKLRPYFHKVGVAPVAGVCSTDILVIVPKFESWASFILCCISSDDFVEFANRDSDGTKMPRTNWSSLERFAVVIPPDTILNKFNSSTYLLFKKIVENIHQSRTLAQIRDALLPKLMSGQLNVNEVNGIIQEIG
jgi:type I restriction enzyme S subunit